MEGLPLISQHFSSQTGAIKIGNLTRIQVKTQIYEDTSNSDSHLENLKSQKFHMNT